MEQLVVYGLGSMEDSVVSRWGLYGPPVYLLSCVGCTLLKPDGGYAVAGTSWHLPFS